MPIFPGPPIPQANPDGSIPTDNEGGGSGDGNPNGFQSILAATLAVATKLTVPAGTVYALVSPSGGAVSWRDDGVAPTGAVGIQMASGSVQTFEGPSLAAVEFIEATGSAANLNVSYYT